MSICERLQFCGRKNSYAEKKEHSVLLRENPFNPKKRTIRMSVYGLYYGHAEEKVKKKRCWRIEWRMPEVLKTRQP